MFQSCLVNTRNVPKRDKRIPDASARGVCQKDKLVVENPGSILQEVPQHFNLVDITLECVPRNPRIVEWMRLMKNDRGQPLVRALREGTERMRQEMHKMGLPPPSYETVENTTVTLSF